MTASFYILTNQIYGNSAAFLTNTTRRKFELTPHLEEKPSQKQKAQHKYESVNNNFDKTHKILYSEVTLASKRAF